MKRLVSAIFLLFLALHAFGQFGNEWISFGQPYFKIPAATSGMYRITFQALQNAGLTGSPDPRSFQLFHRGVEQAILVAGEDDGVFDSSDYIEFFGQANDGASDSSLYQQPSFQAHRYYNLFTDTTAYFLTYGSGSGKRMASYLPSGAAAAPQSFHWAERLLVLKESYSGGVDYGDVQQTVFDQGEGWMGALLRQGQEVRYQLSDITATVPGAGKPRVEILLTGRGSMYHQVDLYAGSRHITTATFSGYESYLHTGEIEWTDIDANGTLALTVKVSGSGTDRVSADYVRLLFPRETTMSGASQQIFSFPATAADESSIDIESAPAQTRLFDVTQAAGVVRIPVTEDAALHAVIPTDTQRKILALSQPLAPAWIKRVSFRQFTPGIHSYVIITHPALRKPAGGYVDPVKAYAEYRAQPDGGGFDTLVTNIGQLYDEFNYGEASPRAIFRFLKYLASVRMPDYLFLIGKGLDVNYGYRRNPSAFPVYKDFVPTAGYPASDLAFSAGLGGISNVPAISTGRLSATSPEEVATYLAKVKEHDARPFSDLRRKNILHLSGGIEETEPEAFRQIMSGFQAVAEDVYLGARVKAISKGSTDVTLINIADEVNKGVGLITFFGHSAPNTLDFDIGRATDPVMGYDNAGKYPFLLMNGCDAGSFFLNGDVLGEDWVMAPQKGGIGFIAHSSYGLVSYLQRYSMLFYQVAFGDSVFIHKSVGDVQREVARRYLASFSATPKTIAQIQQMVLQGDPALKLFGAGKPDLAIDADEISVSTFGDDPLTVYTDSFQLHIPVRNYGIVPHTNIRVQVRRESASPGVVLYDSIFAPVFYEDTLVLMIRNRNQDGYGINTFTVTVDADNIVDELNETNNTAVFEYLIPANSTRNLYPYPYSIVTNPEVQLSFQYTDLQAGARQFLLEIDTTDAFDSPFRQQYAVTARVLGRQKVSLLPGDTTVYYWRTRLAEPLENESRSWAVSSFTYIDDSREGWAQLDFPQFKANDATGLVRDPVLRKLTYTESTSDVAIRTFSSAAAASADSISVKINGAEFNLRNGGAACRNNTMNFIAFDRKSTQPYAGLYFKWYELLYDYGGRTLLCGREPYVINSFRPQEMATGNGDDLIQYVDNIHDGDSVVFFNIGNAGYTAWPEPARSKLGELGVATGQLADIPDGEACVIFGRKGAAPGTAKVFRAASGENSLVVDATLSGRYSTGVLSSVSIGPALQWQEAVFQARDIEPVDDFTFSIVGIRSNGATDTLKRQAVSGEDLSFIDAETYPFLKLVFQTRDEVNLTPVQLAGWVVYYEPVPEGLVFYRGSAEAQQRSEGERYEGEFGFVNVSDVTFGDSLTIRYQLLNALRPVRSPSTLKILPPSPGDTTLFTIPFNTVSHEGLNDVEVFVNPRIQQEKSYDNNLILLPDYLLVVADKLDPVMEVTFDGRIIRDLEYVEAGPDIAIRLRDENAVMPKRDTLDVNIFLSFPCAEEPCSFQRVSFSRPDVSWEPAGVDQDFTVHFTPQQLPPGTFTLQVDAGDASGNGSGETPYQIRFRVADDRVFEVDKPYPNPFVFETGFDIVIAGDSDIPYHSTLEIYTINGMPIRKLNTPASGFHVGYNRIAWNGRDEGGRPLENGFYLYRLEVWHGEAKSEFRGRILLLR